MTRVSTSMIQSLEASGEQAFLIRKFYCAPLQKLGKCTGVCANCQENLDRVFKTVREWKDPRNPAAVLTFTLKEKVAEIEEESERPQGLPTTWLGEADTRSPFEMLAEQL